ncbi:MAG: hypothetical protein RL693_335 [Verrucomicrobiota bacterium]|jgi:hypothetical protein
MKILASLLTLLFFVSVLNAETRTWNLGEKGGFQLSHPADAQFEQVSPSTERDVQAFTIRFPDRNGISTISYQVLVAPAEASTDWTDFEKIDAFLNESGQRSLKSSVEKNVVPVHLKMKHGFASYAVFTDPDLVGKEIDRPKNFRHMIMGAGSVKGYTLFVRGYTNSTDSDYFHQMNQILESLEVTGSHP